MRINPINNTAVMPHLSTQRNNMPHHSYISEPVNEPKEDAVSFKGLFRKKVRVDLQNAKFYAERLAASTPERKAIYTGGSLLKDEVKLISLGIAGYAATLAAKDPFYSSNRKPVVLIGRDASDSAKESMDVAKETLKKQGVDVLEIKEPIPAPVMVSTAFHDDIDLAVLMTTSHKYNRNGEYTLISKDGVVAPEEATKEVAKNIEKIAEKGSYKQKLFKRGHVYGFDPFNMYRYALIDSYIDWNNIKNSGLKIYYDDLPGTGKDIVPRILGSFGIPYTLMSSEGKDGPNATKTNLQSLGNIVSQASEHPLRIGLATDSDAEGFGVVDEKGNFISPDDVLLLAAYHLAENRGQKGTIIRSQATSSQLNKLANKYGLDEMQTPVGFSFISEEILKLRDHCHDVLIAGDETGSMAIKNHIPAKDGIMAISLIMDLVAEEGRPISEILKDVKQSLGKQYVSDNFSKSMGFSKNVQERMNKIMAKIEKLYKDAVDLCEDDLGDDVHTIDSEKTEILRNKIKEYKKGDNGIKLIMIDGSSIFVRPDETELKINCYIDAAGKTSAEARTNAHDLKMFMDDLLEL